MKKHRKRPQAQKNTNRHLNNSDKSHARVGAVQRAPRFDRNEFRPTMQRGEW
jgi:hypothetical protein